MSLHTKGERIFAIWILLIEEAMVHLLQRFIDGLARAHGFDRMTFICACLYTLSLLLLISSDGWPFNAAGGLLLSSLTAAIIWARRRSHRQILAERTP